MKPFLVRVVYIYILERIIPHFNVDNLTFIFELYFLKHGALF